MPARRDWRAGGVSCIAGSRGADRRAARAVERWAGRVEEGGQQAHSWAEQRADDSSKMRRRHGSRMATHGRRAGDARAMFTVSSNVLSRACAAARSSIPRPGALSTPDEPDPPPEAAPPIVAPAALCHRPADGSVRRPFTEARRRREFIAVYSGLRPRARAPSFPPDRRRVPPASSVPRAHFQIPLLRSADNSLSIRAVDRPRPPRRRLPDVSAHRRARRPQLIPLPHSSRAAATSSDSGEDHHGPSTLRRRPRVTVPQRAPDPTPSPADAIALARPPAARRHVVASARAAVGHLPLCLLRPVYRLHV